MTPYSWPRIDLAQLLSIMSFFFPSPYLDTEGRISNATFGDYQTAALRGREPNADCGVKYEGCMVNFLELLQGAIDMLF